MQEPGDGAPGSCILPLRGVESFLGSCPCIFLPEGRLVRLDSQVLNREGHGWEDYAHDESTGYFLVAGAVFDGFPDRTGRARTTRATGHPDPARGRRMGRRSGEALFLH